MHKTTQEIPTIGKELVEEVVQVRLASEEGEVRAEEVGDFDDLESHFECKCIWLKSTLEHHTQKLESMSRTQLLDGYFSKNWLT